MHLPLQSFGSTSYTGNAMCPTSASIPDDRPVHSDPPRKNPVNMKNPNQLFYVLGKELIEPSLYRLPSARESPCEHPRHRCAPANPQDSV
ncbi:hypothetical protein PISMIDRAFT_682040 [Pisolithus microcarpus 441]|uniref:Uncharacterized protein n=1 Tax=Pisolithus microcarpus 441 TaxID=765257 RepID=A0A0C9Z3P2_9AGAM|nr:hypothetical protein PISMIDRAFT_682040 [Pisolithus microcarpus 441]